MRKLLVLIRVCLDLGIRSGELKNGPGPKRKVASFSAAFGLGIELPFWSKGVIEVPRSSTFELGLHRHSNEVAGLGGLSSHSMPKRQSHHSSALTKSFSTRCYPWPYRPHVVDFSSVSPRSRAMWSSRTRCEMSYNFDRITVKTLTLVSVEHSSCPAGWSQLALIPRALSRILQASATRQRARIMSLLSVVLTRGR
jgi:hypothetical protein